MSTGRAVYKSIAERVRDRRLELVGPILRAFLRASKRLRNLQSYLAKRPSSPVEVRDDIYEGVFAVAFRIPGSGQMLYVFYASAQEWYLTPCKVPPKARKVLEARRLMSEPRQDSFVAILVKRSTSGARRLGARLGVPVITYRQAEEAIKRYVAKRYTQLLASVRGRRIFGELAALLYALQAVAEEIVGEGIPKAFNDEIDAIRCVERGCTAKEGLGPPSRE